MSEKYDIGPRITIDGEAEYKRQMQDLAKVTKTLTAEGKRLTAEYEDNADSVEAVSRKSDLYNRQLDVQSKKISLVESQIEKASDAYGKAAKVTEEWKEKLEDAQKELDDLKNSSDASADAIKEQGRVVDAIQSAYMKAENQSRSLGNKLQDLKTDLENAKTAQIQTGKALRQMSQDAEQSSDSVDDYTDSIEQSTDQGMTFGDVMKRVFNAFGVDADDAIDGTISALESFNGSLDGSNGKAGAVTGAIAGSFTGVLIPAIGKVIDKVGELTQKVVGAALEAEETEARIQVALGLTKEEAREAQHSIDALNASGIFKGGEAESTLTTVMRYFDVTGDEGEDLAIRLKSSFGSIGADMGQTAEAASIMTSIFKDSGVTSVDAMDMLLAACQSRYFKQDIGEIISAVKEFSPAFEAAGYSAEEMFNFFASAADHGAQDLGKVGDALNDFQAASAKGEEGWKEAMHNLGFDVDMAMNKMAKGGNEARNLFSRVLEKLMEMPAGMEKASLSTELLGSALDDTSLDILYSATQMESQLKNVSGATTRAVMNMTSTTSAELRGLGSQALTHAREWTSAWGDIATGDLKGATKRILYSGEVFGSNFASQNKITGERAGTQLGEGYAINAAGSLTQGGAQVSEAQQEINEQLMMQMSAALQEMGVSAADIPRIMSDAIASTGGVINEETVALLKQAAQNGTAYSENFAGGIRGNSGKIAIAAGDSINEMSTLMRNNLGSIGSLLEGDVENFLNKQKENFDSFGVDLGASTREAGQGAASNLSGGLLDGQPEISAASQAIGQAIPQDAAQAVIANSGVMENAGKAVVGPLSQGVEESKGGFLSAIGNLLSAAAKKVSEFFSGLKKSSANTVASATSAQSRSAAPASVQYSAAPVRAAPVAARSRIMAMPTPPSGPLDVETIAARVGSASTYAAQQAQQITMAVQAASGPQSVKVELPKMQQPVVNEYHTYNITGNVKDWKDLETLQQICQRERGRKQAIRKGISTRG